MSDIVCKWEAESCISSRLVVGYNTHQTRIAKIVYLPEEVGEKGDITDFFSKCNRNKEDFMELLKKEKSLRNKNECPTNIECDSQEKKFVKEYLQKNGIELMKQLGTQSYTTLDALADFIGNTGQCYVSQETVAKTLEIGREAVCKRIRKLLNIKKKRHYHGQRLLKLGDKKLHKNGKKTNTYIFFPDVKRGNVPQHGEEEATKENQLNNKASNRPKCGQEHTNININVNNTGEKESLFEKLTSKWQGDKTCPGIPTGFKNLDGIIGGLRPKCVIVIGGSSGTGKTTTGLNIGYNVALQGKKVVYITLQNSKDELRKRLICRELGIDILSLDKRNLNNEQEARLKEVCDGIESLPLNIKRIDLSTNNLNSLEQSIDEDASLLIIDYLQKIGPSKQIYERMSEAMSHLERIALNYDIPVIAVSQLKDVRTEAGAISPKSRKPIKEDLEGGQPIHQNAKVVLLLWASESDRKGDKLEIIVDKNNDGEDKISTTLNYNREYFHIY